MLPQCFCASFQVLMVKTCGKEALDNNYWGDIKKKDRQYSFCISELVSHSQSGSLIGGEWKR